MSTSARKLTNSKTPGAFPALSETVSLTCYLKIQIFITHSLLWWCFAQQLTKRRSKLKIPFQWKLFQYLGKGFNSTGCRIRCRFACYQEYIPLSRDYYISVTIPLFLLETISKMQLLQYCLVKTHWCFKGPMNNSNRQSALRHHKTRASGILKSPDRLKCTPASPFLRIVQQNSERGWAQCHPRRYCPRLAPLQSPHHRDADWWSCWAPGARWVPLPRWSWSDKGWNIEG